MANKQALRDLQTRLAERLRAARTQARGESWLAVESSGHGFLFPLREAGEIFSLAPTLPVPHAEPWFLGVANLRGHLHGVVGLAGFLGIEPAQRQAERVSEKMAAPGAPTARTQARLVGFNQSLELNCVLFVDRLAGLRSDAELTREADDGAPRPAFAGGRLRDAAGRRWQELSLAALAGDDAFLKIAG